MARNYNQLKIADHTTKPRRSTRRNVAAWLCCVESGRGLGGLVLVTGSPDGRALMYVAAEMAVEKR
ncbi:hypothetical protein GCM10027200_03700 [Lentzea nigeriaca]